MYLSLAAGDIPFVVPVFYAYDGTAVYFHAATVGTKIKMLKQNNKVCFVVSLDHGVIAAEEPCDFEARHRTVIGYGEAVFLTDDAAKAQALDRIVARFTDKKCTYPQTQLHATSVIRIAITSSQGENARLLEANRQKTRPAFFVTLNNKRRLLH